MQTEVVLVSLANRSTCRMSVQAYDEYLWCVCSWSRHINREDDSEEAMSQDDNSDMDATWMPLRDRFF